MLDDEGMFRPSGGGIFSHLPNELNVFQPISTWLNNIRFQGIFELFCAKLTEMINITETRKK